MPDTMATRCMAQAEENAASVRGDYDAAEQLARRRQAAQERAAAIAAAAAGASDKQQAAGSFVGSTVDDADCFLCPITMAKMVSISALA